MTEDYKEGYEMGFMDGRHSSSDPGDQCREERSIMLETAWEDSDAQAKEAKVAANLQRLEEGLQPGDRVKLSSGLEFWICPEGDLRCKWFEPSHDDWFEDWIIFAQDKTPFKAILTEMVRGGADIIPASNGGGDAS